MSELIRHTHAINEAGDVVEFFPGDVVPEWAVGQLTNPALWADAPASGPVAAGVDAASAATDQPDHPDEPDGAASHQDIMHVAEPPRGGPGSGRAAWAAHADRLAVDVTDDMTRDDIIDAVEAASGG